MENKYEEKNIMKDDEKRRNIIRKNYVLLLHTENKPELILLTGNEECY